MQRTKLHYKPGTATVVIPAAGLRAYRESLVQTRFTSNQFVSHALPYDHLTRTGHIDPHLLGLFDIDCAKSRQPASLYMTGTRHEINNYRVDIDGPPSATVIGYVAPSTKLDVFPMSVLRSLFRTRISGTSKQCSAQLFVAGVCRCRMVSTF